MKGLGFAGIIIGVIVCVVALMMTTTVETVSSYSGIVPGLPSSVHNLGLLQVQQLAFSAGLALFVAGSVVAALGHIGEILSRGGSGMVNTPPPNHFDQEYSAAPPPSGDPVEQNRADAFAFKVRVVLAVIIALAVAFTVFGGGVYEKSPAAAAIEANADMLADNMEMEADNLDAMADAAARIK